MTLQELIDELQALPTSARTAAVVFELGELEETDDVTSIRYEGGEVRLRFEDFINPDDVDDSNEGWDEP